MTVDIKIVTASNFKAPWDCHRMTYGITILRSSQLMVITMKAGCIIGTSMTRTLSEAGPSKMTLQKNISGDLSTT